MSHEIDLAADRIVASVRRPWFPPRNFPVTRFSAVGDGTTAVDITNLVVKDVTDGGTPVTA